MFSRPVHIWFPATFGPSKPGIWSFQRSETASMVPLRQLPAVTWKRAGLLMNHGLLQKCGWKLGKVFSSPCHKQSPRDYYEWLEVPKTFKLDPFGHWTYYGRTNKWDLGHTPQRNGYFNRRMVIHQWFFWRSLFSEQPKNGCASARSQCWYFFTQFQREHLKEFRGILCEAGSLPCPLASSQLTWTLIFICHVFFEICLPNPQLMARSMFVGW